MSGEAQFEGLRRSSFALAAIVLFACASAAGAEVAGKTTVEQTLVPGGGAFRLPSEGPGEAYTTRTEDIGSAQAGRERRRLSLLYFGQLTDFQLADEGRPRESSSSIPLARRSMRCGADGGADPAHRRRRHPPGERVRPAEPARGLERRPGEDDLRPDDRRQRRQPAAQRDGVGRTRPRVPAA